MDTLNNHTNCLTVLSNFNSIATRKENSLHKVYLWLFFISQYKSKLHPLGNILCIHVIPHPYEQDLNLWLVPFEFHHELGRANQQCQGRTHSIYPFSVADPDPHYFDKSDPDSHQSEKKLEPDPHQHQSQCRIRIRIKFEVKIQELWRIKM